ncbi:hypothetical protein ABI013_12900 [Enterococcus faecium]|uniref:hypothetical protein n=1 Tax=Enterococcus faecium TaxID=1352 RepID=UPI001E4804ED|nr:hypothetical protein [Enterococcus faecium]MCE3156817.1 hypothetical protein [Enterococcus faecium]MCE3187915.1 hypothetical protein [Enterococcus faecium]MCU2175508.1 hypothetical protein [Enterococcus faecium]MDN3734263.1 hypothetical protein [Enterococcus faecium]MDW8788020.1 hypothetical protein [Enterococcus faecium]
MLNALELNRGFLFLWSFSLKIILARKNGTLLEALRAELPAFEQTIVPEFKGAVRAVLKKIHRPSIGVKMGEIANYSSTSSPMGQLKKMFG